MGIQIFRGCWFLKFYNMVQKISVRVTEINLCDRIQKSVKVDLHKYCS